jgi:hypothetical protein
MLDQKRYKEHQLIISKVEQNHFLKKNKNKRKKNDKFINNI